MTKAETIAKYGEEAWEKQLAAGRRWQNANREYFRLYRRKYKAIHGNLYSLPGVAKNSSEYKEEHPCCELCGSTDHIECHHLNPLTMDTYKEARNKYNLMTLCKKCHTRYHRDLLSFADYDKIAKRKREALEKMINDAFKN